MNPDTSLPSSPADMKDILDIEDILAPQSHLWIWIVLGTLLAALLIFLLVRLFSWWKKRRAMGEEVLRPLAKALMELQRLKKQNFLERGEHRKYYFFASEILRRFIEEEHGYPALEKTTEEITRDWEVQAYDFNRETALSFLRETDQVKFADGIFPLPKMQALVDDLEKILRKGEKKVLGSGG